MHSVRDYIGRNPGDWPTEHEENGNYRVECRCCGAVVTGPKRAMVCYPCHQAAKRRWEALTPEQQAAEIAQISAAVKALNLQDAKR
jgi:hypothetical protein